MHQLWRTHRKNSAFMRPVHHLQEEIQPETITCRHIRAAFIQEVSVMKYENEIIWATLIAFSVTSWIALINFVSWLCTKINFTWLF